MRLASGAGRRVGVLLLIALIGGILPVQSFGQVSNQVSSALQSVIDKSEASYLEGEQALIKGQLDQARKLFDQAIGTVVNSGIDLNQTPRLSAYHRDLTARIQRHLSSPVNAAIKLAPPAAIEGVKPQAPPTAQPAVQSQPVQPTQENSDSVQQKQTGKPAEPAEKTAPAPVAGAQEPGEVTERAVLDDLAQVNESELAAETPGGIKIFGRYDFEFSVAPPVFQYMSYFVSGRGRSTMETGLRRSGRYRQMAEKIFEEEGVPVDLVWLAQAESVWKPNALSHAAAKGIWQFIPGTGARYGLAQTTWVDDRSHPEKSTRAAARYLKFLHTFFAGDWLLAMAAYNSGEYRIANAISKCGYADFWELHRRGLIPTETRNYVPIILSIIIVSKNQKRYGFSVTPDLPLNYDTFSIPTQTDLKVIADLIGIPYETMQDLNPELRRGVTPSGIAYNIKLPKGFKSQFETAYAALPEDQRIRKVVIPRAEIAENAKPSYRSQNASYEIRRGDTLSSVARRHGVSVKELARLNGMSSRSALRNGQTIQIPAGSEKSVGKSRGRYKAKNVSRSRATVKGKVKKESKRGSSSKKTSRRRR